MMMTMQLRDADTMMHVRDCDFFPVDKPQHRSYGGTAGSHTLNRGLPVMERAERRSFGLRHEAKPAKGATRLPDYYSLQLTHYWHHQLSLFLPHLSRVPTLPQISILLWKRRKAWALTRSFLGFNPATPDVTLTVLRTFESSSPHPETAT